MTEQPLFAIPPRQRAHGLLLLTAALWGLAFVAQRVGMAYLGPFTFNALRFALGALALTLLERVRPSTGARLSQPDRRGWLLGAVLFAGASLQQMGLVYTTAGKAGFITGLYVVLVPLAATGLYGQRQPPLLWTAAGLAVAGLYLLSGAHTLALSRGDGLVLLSAFFWTAHVLLIDHWSRAADGLHLARRQFWVVALGSGIVALASESLTWAAFKAALPALAYGGLISVGVGYTLQVIAQREAHPTAAAVLLSLEAVFALVGGVLWLGEPLTLRELTGAALMLAGMVGAQMAPVGHPPADE